MLRKSSIPLVVLVTLLMAGAIVSAQINHGIDSGGSIRGYQGKPLEPTYQSYNIISILVFNPDSDVVDRLTGLGYAVTETSDPADLNQTNLQNFDVLWISCFTDPLSYYHQNDEIQTWVSEDGGGLIVNPPYISGAIVSVFPSGFEVGIYSSLYPGNYDATIVDHDHPITHGLWDTHLSGNFNWVRSEDIGALWDILAVDLETPDDIALLAGEYGNGRLVFHTGNFDSYADPGHDQYLVQMIDWTGGDVPDTCTLDLILTYTGGTLNMDFYLGTSEPATINVWFNVLSQIIPYLSVPLPPIDPPISVPIAIPGVPSIGTIGVLTTLTTPDGIICSDWETVDTGPMTTVAPSAEDIKQLLRK